MPDIHWTETRWVNGQLVETIDHVTTITQEEANQRDIETKARTALANNATFLAIANPTAAQNGAQAKALTRQVNGLIRLALGQLADVSDT